MASWMFLLAMLMPGQQTQSASYGVKYRETTGRCLLVAEGHSYMLNPCRYYFYDTSYGDHSLLFDKKRPRNYFARFGSIDFDDATRMTGEGSWNGPNIRNLHGDHSVGKMRRNGNCWRNAEARFCFWPAPVASRGGK